MRKVGKKDYLGRDRVQTVNEEDSMTVQSDAHLADVNRIMKEFGLDGSAMLDETALIFADVSEFTDLQDALNQAKVAENEFMKLPSKVREIFGHDVAVWLDTAHDEDKRAALVAAGFLKAPKEPAILEIAVQEGSLGEPVKPAPVQEPVKPAPVEVEKTS